ncbi:hypothetical protein J6590_079573 [Homalodisca vitripennis]|nr:hypothetical protein J6590_093508 [Homalodisca vitripennis]KAG8329758.1 hypothetical protein J6590_079573 [Homalodisca vitripennis]
MEAGSLTQFMFMNTNQSSKNSQANQAFDFVWLLLDHNKVKQLSMSTSDDNATVDLTADVSSRRVNSDAEISQGPTLRILKDRKIHLYRISLNQELYGDYFLLRMNFIV